MKQSKALLVALAFAAGVVTSTHAVILIPDVAVPLPGTDGPLRPELAGVVIEDNLVPFTISLSGGRTITGQIQERVSRETVAGTLDFYWRVFIDPNSAGSIGSFRLGNFLTGTYDADWRTDGLGTVGPDYGYLFGGGQGFVNFGFTAGLTPADGSSYFMFLHTDATEYNKSAEMDVAVPGFGFISDSFATFAPVPEPASAALLVLAIAGFVVARRPGRIG